CALCFGATVRRRYEGKGEMRHQGAAARRRPEPGAPPLWTQLGPQIRHRQVGRVMRAFSVVYGHDIGGALEATIGFRVDGEGSGNWYVNVAPGATTSGQG